MECLGTEPQFCFENNHRQFLSLLKTPVCSGSCFVLQLCSSTLGNRLFFLSFKENKERKSGANKKLSYHVKFVFF